VDSFIMPPHAPFRAARLDIGSFINKWVIRDHTKRKVFAEYEADRLVQSFQLSIHRDADHVFDE
jgi:hypothetical protein